MDGLPAWSIFIEVGDLTPWSYAALISPIIIAGFAASFKINGLQYLKIPCVHTAARKSSDHKYAGDDRLQTDDLLSNDVAATDDIAGNQIKLQAYHGQSGIDHGLGQVNFQASSGDYAKNSTRSLSESTSLSNNQKKDGSNTSVSITTPVKSSLESSITPKTQAASAGTSSVDTNKKAPTDLNLKIFDVSNDKKPSTKQPENPEDKNPKDKNKKKVTFSETAIDLQDKKNIILDSSSFVSKTQDKKEIDVKKTQPTSSIKTDNLMKDKGTEKLQSPSFLESTVDKKEKEFKKAINITEAKTEIKEKQKPVSLADEKINVKSEAVKVKGETVSNKKTEIKETDKEKSVKPVLDKNITESLNPISKSSSPKPDEQLTLATQTSSDKKSETNEPVDPTKSKVGNAASKYNSFNAMESIFSAKKNLQKSEIENETNSKKESKVISKMKVGSLEPAIPLIPGYKPVLTEVPIKTILPTTLDLKKTLEKVSPFDAVPGPTILKTIGNLWKYVPILGTQFVASFIYSMQSVISSYDRKLQYPSTYPYYYLLNKFGPMVRLHSPVGADILIAAVNGEDLPLIHSKTKGNKARSLFDSMNTYRKEALSTDTNFGLGSNIDKSKLQGNPILTMDKYYSSIENITDKLLRKGGKFIIGHTGENQDENHENDLMRWALQCNLDVYFKSVKNILEGGSNNSDKLVESFLKTSKSIRLSETGIQLWRAFTTLTWLDLTENSKYLDSFISDEVTKCMAGLNNGKMSGSVTEALLTTEELKASDVLTPLLDLLVINVNTVAYTTGFLLYNISRTPQVQRTLHREISNVLPKGKNIAQADLAKLKYLNACIIETLRLSPPFPYLSRELDEDTMINGYLIPKGTFVQMVNVLPCARGDYMCEEIGKFQAERWTEKGSTMRGDLLAGLPQWNSFPNFNKDFVVAQIALLTAKVIKDYRMEYPAAEIYTDGMVMSGPTKPFNFKFIERQL